MLHFNILHYQFLWIFHDKIQSNMHNFTLFSREIEWNLKCFHFFREMKSETNIPFTLFEKWKVKWFFVSLFLRSESEIEIPRDRDREVKFQKNSREFSRNETLAGYCDKQSSLNGILFRCSPAWKQFWYEGPWARRCKRRCWGRWWWTSQCQNQQGARLPRDWRSAGGH